MELKTVRYGIDAGVATVTLDRPERGNAWTGRMEAEYRWVLGELDRSPHVGVIVLTGAGQRFCVGADVRAVSANAEAGEYRSGRTEPLTQPGDPSHPAFGSRHGFLLSLSKPVVAAVNGAAAGIGFVLASFADVRFVAEDAKLTTSTSKLGLPPEFAISWILPRLVGVTRATDLLLRSAVIRGREAVEIGWALRALPAEDVLPAALAYAATLVACSAPSSMAAVKQMVWRDLERSLSDADADAQHALERATRHPDFRTGAAALAARTDPDYSGRYRPTEEDR
ncbi:enoyl-CoA hydratase-related protein [Pseudonocardia sp. NPDC049154]|uniref:enoyl-CoA hydratase-related protein n=1 Tax=Pseudonocardia sp. NPDC049154 TaxID=3155501 RepID=UPI003402D1EA